jgi:hypothetical protein
MLDAEPWGPTFMPSELDDETLGRYLDDFLWDDMRYLAAHPETPALYDSGCVYIPEPRGKEVWRAVPHVLENGGSVCHSLSCWRAAELRNAGIDARPVWTVQELGDGSALYHVVVYVAPCDLAPDGMLDDPSARLGMPGGIAPQIAMPRTPQVANIRPPVNVFSKLALRAA